MDCLCIADSTPVAVPGLCVEPCNALTPFLACFFFVVMVDFMTATPALLIAMRYDNAFAVRERILPIYIDLYSGVCPNLRNPSPSDCNGLLFVPLEQFLDLSCSE